MKKPFRITIDDLGLFPEVEKGILSLKEFGIPIYCSWLTNYCPPSAEIKQAPFHNGLHFNIIEGPSHTKAESLADSRGYFHKKWFEFVVASRKMKSAVAAELEIQLTQALAWFGSLSHLDSHLHLHSIPWIQELLAKAQQKHGIPYLRNPSQPVFHSSTHWSRPAQVVKIGILNTLTHFSNLQDPPCFGLTEHFQMSAAFCREHLADLKGREVVWHAADLPDNPALEKFRFMDEAQFRLRKGELEELRSFLRSLQ